MLQEVLASLNAGGRVVNFLCYSREYGKLGLMVFVNAHDAAHITTSVAVVGALQTVTTSLLAK